MQGLLSTIINIDGRTRIQELERFIQELMTVNRKVVATCVFLTNQTGVDSSYHKFGEEFSRDQRVGISNNLTKTIQVYIIPSSLKDQISILRTVKLKHVGIL